MVRNVVDGAAKGIDFEHRPALGARQNAHGKVKRAARGARRRFNRNIPICSHGSVHAS
jgi:hypothetical protein